MHNRMKEFREKKEWSQVKLAEESGVSRQTIIALESGTVKECKTSTLVKLADALDSTVSAIFFPEEVQHVKH